MNCLTKLYPLGGLLSPSALQNFFPLLDASGKYRPAQEPFGETLQGLIRGCHTLSSENREGGLKLIGPHRDEGWPSAHQPERWEWGRVNTERQEWGRVSPERQEWGRVSTERRELGRVSSERREWGRVSS